MASLRPASRALTRLSSTTLRQTTSSNTHTSLSLLRPILLPFQLTPPHKSNFSTRSPLSQRVPPKDPASNDAYPTGSPGEPKPGDSLPSGIPPSTLYTFADIQSISTAPASYPNKLLIDVREPSELLATGRIPGAVNIPVSSAPDAFFLSGEDFEDKYGFERPDEGTEVIFYCKAGVRSKAAARLAGQAGFGGKVGEFPGSWVEWEGKGGQVQRE